MFSSKRGSDTDTYRTRLRPRLYQRAWFQIMFGGAAILCLVAVLALFLFLKPRKERAYALDLDEIEKLEIPSRIYDRHGREIGQIKVEDRRPISLDQVPYHLIQALTAVEDSRFFEHNGIDYIGIVRAMLLNFKAGRITQGASTITQQLAKQTYDDLRLNRTFDNKIVEAFLARRFEQKFTKDQILEHYLNRVFFGSGYFGIETAARGYFGKSVAEIDIVEAATLTGLIKSPSRLSPKNNPDQSRTARNYVLRRMHTEGMITSAELAEFSRRPIGLNPSKGQQNSYVNEIIRLRVIDELGFEKASTGGFKIYTTIDRDVQAAARQSLRHNLTKAEAHPGYQHPTYAHFVESSRLPDPLGDSPGAARARTPDYLQGAVLAIENHSGGIIAMVGGRDFRHSQFNRALLARRPPGTAFTPFVYAAAFGENFFPGSIIKDAPIDNRSVAIGGTTGILGEWGNESDKVTYLGDIPAREALIQSKNAATVRIGKKVGRDKVIALAARAGIASPMDDYDRCLLGSSGVKLDEFCKAFSIFPNGGTRPDKLHLITSVADTDGQIIFSEPVTTMTRAIDPIAAYQVHSCLAESLQRGTAKNAYTKNGLLDKNAGGKTGTAYNFSDLWFVGYNNQITCGIWVGFDKPGSPAKPIYRGAFSNVTALPIWVDTLNASLPAFPSTPIPLPDGAQTVEICKKSGRRATDACYEELPGSEPGARKIERYTYKEIIRANIDFHIYCDYHSDDGESLPGEIVPQIARIDPQIKPILSSGSANAILVRSPTVIGSDDPYHSIQPILRTQPTDPDDKTEVRRASPVNPISLNSTTTLPIDIDRPKPLSIPELDQTPDSDQ